MEEQWYVDRYRLRELRQTYPQWTNQQLADAVGRSLGWVKKWKKRLQDAAGDDEQGLRSQSRCPKTVEKRVRPEVVAAIIDIRDNPPDNLGRIPGPKTILYYLHQNDALRQAGHYLPRSSSTIWAILDAQQRIYRPPQIEHHPIERPAPMVNWQIDFKDVTTATDEASEKQRHQVEVLNVLDVGTSVLLANPVHAAYNAETAIDALIHTLEQWGCPTTITFDRDPRFVGSAQSRDFPAAFVRCLHCLGIAVDVCPPQRPDLNAFVERYHRTYEYECLRIHKPHTLDEVAARNEQFAQHYNYERPNQARTCANQPPRLAFPALPVGAALPETVDPDAWLESLHQQPFPRRVTHNGTVRINKQPYYVGRHWRGRTVLLRLNAPLREFCVELEGQLVKRIPIKGLHDQLMTLDDYLDLIKQEAISEWRQYRQQAVVRTVATM